MNKLLTTFIIDSSANHFYNNQIILVYKMSNSIFKADQLSKTQRLIYLIWLITCTQEKQQNENN